ncbi:MAG: T9SS type A sorting domain-containing protein, partial [Candidatus Eisenbacteria bacterium]|nr:T9SS type A sorting domain-containing protein [Candidatus Eisenbacteria bacterium]
AGTDQRLGIDRDLDGYLDADEIDAGSDPGNPLSTPGTVDAPQPTSIPLATRLEPLWPNPSTSASRIAYRVLDSGVTTLTVHDVNGRLVRTLARGVAEAAGRHERVWDLRGDDGVRVPAGMYYVRMQADGRVLSQRVVVQR